MSTSKKDRGYRIQEATERAHEVFRAVYDQMPKETLTRTRKFRHLTELPRERNPAEQIDMNRIYGLP